MPSTFARVHCLEGLAGVSAIQLRALGTGKGIWQKRGRGEARWKPLDHILRLGQCPLFKETSSHIPCWSHFSGTHTSVQPGAPSLRRAGGPSRVRASCWLLAEAVEWPRSHHGPSSFGGPLGKPRGHRTGVKEGWKATPSSFLPSCDWGARH